ncbi:hypothetical protein BH11MYX4_BH11MYX4_34310 [soil metagenome]
MSRRLGAAIGVGSLALALAGAAEARPQISSGVTTGVAFTDLRAGNGPRVAYQLGGRLDLLFGRESPRDMALGPYLELTTAAFDTFETGGGVAWLVPTGSPAFVFSAGGFARTSRFGVEPGAAATIFWGARSYNYHSSYAVAAGLFAQGRYGLSGDGQQADALVGVQLDLEYFALPFVFAYQAIRR